MDGRYMKTAMRASNSLIRSVFGVFQALEVPKIFGKAMVHRFMLNTLNGHYYLTEKTQTKLTMPPDSQSVTIHQVKRHAVTLRFGDSFRGIASSIL